MKPNGTSRAEYQQDMQQKHLKFALYRLRTWLEYRRDQSLSEGSRKQANERVRLWINEVRKCRGGVA